MKPNIIVLCIAFVCVFILSSCTFAPKIVLLNNSGYTVKVQQGTKTIGIVNTGQSVEFYYPSADQMVFIKTETTSWSYNFTTNSPPHEYFLPPPERRERKLRVQLEATGELYLLLPTEEFPLTNFTNQPSGFPLKPIVQETPK